MKVRATTNFAGEICMAVGETRDVPESIAAPLMRCGYLEMVESAPPDTSPEDPSADVQDTSPEDPPADVQNTATSEPQESVQDTSPEDPDDTSKSTSGSKKSRAKK
uniref:Uncharacterized protein n=1 Tax=Siphoviridae sp. ctP6113 TaxID=2826318 RepID=A0A8S5MUD7_9CAUD|nr:MAG TPA: hypothetical protein [Siphoviridae sp. ctP6113]